MRLPDSSLFIGSLGVIREGEVGYIVHPKAWGKGVAPEALVAFLPTYFEKYSTVEKLTGHVDSENVRSQRVLIRLGFEEKERHSIETVELGTRTEVVFEIERNQGLQLRVP